MILKATVPFVPELNFLGGNNASGLYTLGGPLNSG
jgi:hypothetical protein